MFFENFSIYNTTNNENLTLSFILNKLLGEIIEIQLPILEMFKLSGIFIFKEHLFYNLNLFSKSTKIEILILKNIILENTIKENDIPINFINEMKNYLKNDFDNWELVKFKELFDSNFYLLLNNLNVFSINNQESINFGLYYKSLIPKEIISNSNKCWILK